MNDYLILKKLDKLTKLVKEEMIIMGEMEDAVAGMKVKVTNLVTIDDSVVALLEGLVAQLKTIAEQLANEGADVTDLNALTDTLSAEEDRLAAAVTANTPVAPVPPAV